MITFYALHCRVGRAKSSTKENVLLDSHTSHKFGLVDFETLLISPYSRDYNLVELAEVFVPGAFALRVIRNGLHSFP
jgi:hypothetical protein